MYHLRLCLALGAGMTFAPLVLTQVAHAEDPGQERLIIAEPGQLPILITAPHGGTKPIPRVAAREDRQGDRVNLRRDELTNRLAVLTADAVEQRAGKRPFLVVAEFARSALDANRPEETAFQQSAAAPYYQAYHRAINDYSQSIRREWGHGLLIDLHAQWLRPDAIMRGTRDGQTIEGLLKRQGWNGVVGADGVLGSLAADGIPLFPPSGQSEGEWTHVGSTTIVKYGREGMDGLQLEIGSRLCDSEEDVQKLARQLAVAIERHLRAERQLSVISGDPETSLTALVDPENNEHPAATPNSAPPGPALNEAEQAFADLLTNSVLVGRFSIDGAWDKEPKTERYAISRVTKVEEDNWIILARITYGQVDLTVPVPVKVHWAADTPVISLTDLKIPGLGEGFTTRVLFYENRYAGSWYHGMVGGHMWGTIEKSDQPAEKRSDENP